MYQLSKNELDRWQFLYKKFYEKAMKGKVLFQEFPLLTTKQS